MWRLHGRGIAFFVTEITPEIATELAENGVSDERFDGFLRRSSIDPTASPQESQMATSPRRWGSKFLSGFNDVDGR